MIFNFPRSKQQAQVSLPDEYVKLNYIESSGTQYINTGVIVDGNTGFDVTINVLNTLASSPYYNLFGVHGNDSSGGSSETQNFFRIDTIPVDNGTGTELKYGSTIYNSGIVSTNQKMRIRLKNKVYTKPDGSNITLSGNITTGLPMYIFCINKENAPYGNKPNMRIYKFKIYNGSELVRDFVPAKRSSDGIAGLFDMVGQEFYTNVGDDDFIKGPPASEYSILDCLELDGSHYINTNYKPSGKYVSSTSYAYPILDITFKTPTTKGVIAGCDSGYKVNSFMLAVTVASYGTGSQTISVADNSKHNVVFTSGSVSVDGTSKGNAGSGKLSTEYPLYIGANNRSGAVEELITGEIYGCSISTVGCTNSSNITTVVRYSFVPCKEISTKTNGLYDVINGTFYPLIAKEA